MKKSSKKGKVNVSRNAVEYSRSRKEMDTLFPPFSPSNLGKIGYQRIVLKSACHEDSKTPPTCLIWLSFGWDIWG